MLTSPGIQMLVSDLDGTLLDSKGKLSEDNLNALIELGQKHILRVLATGRSMFSLRRALPDLLPVDYIVFSTGAGIVDMRSDARIRQYGLRQPQIEHLIEYLSAHGLSFMIHDPVPENHRFSIYRGKGKLHPDFERRMSYYPDHYRWMNDARYDENEATQFLVVLDQDEALFSIIAGELTDFHVIRTTSPIDHKSIWLEIFPLEVSKGKALQTLMSLHGLSASEVVALGNDYNDIDMLKLAGHAFVTANAPEELRAQWPVIRSNDDHALHNLLTRLKI